MLRRNVAANYLGQGWRALMGMAFVPLYIRYLGIEAYGLIGIYAILQTCLTLLDGGLKPALGREMARFSAGAHSAQSIRDLLRSVEVVAVIVAVLIALGILVASGWLSVHWLSVQTLRLPVIANALTIMGIVAGVQFIESVYSSSIVGLQHQILESALTSLIATIRGVGSVVVLKWLSPTIGAYFLWQIVVSLLSVSLLSWAVYRHLPRSPQAARFSLSALRAIGGFAGGVAMITLLALLLTQVDKVLLTRLLPLREFSYYALAGVLAGALPMLARPIITAFYPRFTEYATVGTEPPLCRAYHQSSQLVSVSVGAMALMLIAHAERILLLWTGDPSLASQTAPLLSVLSIGTLLNTLMWTPYHLQLAYGWTGLAIRINIAAVAVLIPAMLLVIPVYGALGAAWLWVTLNVGYLIFMTHFMHRRLLRTEKWQWLVRDVVVPLLPAGCITVLLKWLLPIDGIGMFAEVMALAFIFCVTMAVAAFTSKFLRELILLRLAPIFLRNP